MKKIILFCGLLAAVAVFSQPVAAQTAVYETSKGSATVYSVSIDTTSGAVHLESVTASRSTKGRFSIEIWNDDNADDLHCSFDALVSTISTNAHYGRRIPPRTSITWAVPDSVKTYCRVAGSGSAAAAIAVITQL